MPEVSSQGFTLDQLRLIEATFTSMVDGLGQCPVYDGGDADECSCSLQADYLQVVGAAKLAVQALHA